MGSRLITTAVLLVATASCGGRAASVPQSKQWGSMSDDEKMVFMTDVVTPRMKAVFEEYDGHRFANFGCNSCHAADGAERDFAMPCPDLLLEPSAWNTGRAAPAEAPSSFDAFMAKSVTPEMAKLLGRPAGCFACHTEER